MKNCPCCKDKSIHKRLVTKGTSIIRCIGCGTQSGEWSTKEAAEEAWDMRAWDELSYEALVKFEEELDEQT